MSRHCVEFVLSQTAAILSIVLKMLVLSRIKSKHLSATVRFQNLNWDVFTGKDEDTTLSERQGALNQMSFFQYVAALLLQQI